MEQQRGDAPHALQDAGLGSEVEGGVVEEPRGAHGRESSGVAGGRRRLGRRVDEADRGGEEEVQPVVGVDLEVEDAARDVLPLARDGRDVRGQLLAEALELAYEQRPPQGGGLAVVVWGFVGVIRRPRGQEVKDGYGRCDMAEVGRIDGLTDLARRR